jgi:hypothetical protein
MSFPHLFAAFTKVSLELCAGDKTLAARPEMISKYGVKVLRVKKTAAWIEAERAALGYLPSFDSCALDAVQEFVESSLLVGLLPGALLDAFDFWRCGGNTGIIWGAFL